VPQPSVLPPTLHHPRQPPSDSNAAQGKEVWQCHGDWLSQHNPELGPGIKDRFQWASTITPEQFEAADDQRKKWGFGGGGGL